MHAREGRDCRGSSSRQKGAKSDATLCAQPLIYDHQQGSSLFQWIRHSFERGFVCLIRSGGGWRELAPDRAGGRGPDIMSRKWYINGRFLTQPVTGVQRYALEVVRA